MKLRTLELVNFQGHGSLLVRFAKSITVIQGPTDIGKSSVLRALRWVCLNDLTGDDFVKEGERETCVTLHIVDKDKEHIIKRIRGTGHTNTYWLDDKEYKAFGTSVPEDIAKLLRLTELNFQAQYDSPFWFDESGAEVSRQLNSIVDLGIMDLALSNIASSVRLSQERVKLSQERLEQLEKEYVDIQQLKPRIEAYKGLRQRYEDCKEQKENCDKLAALLVQTKNHQRNFRQFDGQANEGSELVDKAQSILKLSQRTRLLEELITAAEIMQRRAAPPPDFSSVETAFTARRTISEQVTALRECISQAINKRKELERYEKQAVEAEERLHQQTKGEMCPLCGNRIA